MYGCCTLVGTCVYVCGCAYMHIHVCVYANTQYLYACVCMLYMSLYSCHVLCLCMHLCYVWAVYTYVCMHVYCHVFIHTHLRLYTTIKQKLSHKQLHKKSFLTGGVVLLIMCKPFMFIATSTDRSAVPKNLETKELLLSICPLNKTDLEITSEISAHIHSYIIYSDI